MSSVFLYGDVAENFDALSIPFVRASGGQRAEIALLMLPRSREFEARYRDALFGSGAGQVVPIYPSRKLTLDKEQLRALRRSTGILMAGGPPTMYQRAYGGRVVAQMIRGLHHSGVPYGGVSAGAMMACEQFVVGGAILRTKTNEFPPGSREYVAAYPRHRSERRPGLASRKGLGLVRNCVVQPHFTEWGLFPGLTEAMSLTDSRFGLGIDEPIGIEIQNGSKVIVRGKGRSYFFVKPTNRKRDSMFRVRIYEPGSRFDLRE